MGKSKKTQTGKAKKLKPAVTVSRDRKIKNKTDDLRNEELIGQMEDYYESTQSTSIEEMPKR
jgi:hypothetical protein